MLNSDKAMHTLSVYVSNKPGALARIAQVFSRRGFNIESLVVSPAVDGQFSRMTISCSGDPDGLDQIIKQVLKLIDVLQCIDHTYDESVMKEMGLIKIAVDSEGRSEALQIAEHYGCKTVDLTPESMILQVVGNPDKIDALEEMIAKFTIIEFVRTGKVVMQRGQEPT
ncbi:acetolactate synthase small subunit [Pontiella sulfatireligans]|uniref:Acetolactate synthase small subunit n=1 Tax=Pontiella sulfatireligans TaxID=2750658 RepID=A0A6C2UW39_9BACT|nr:acetolactate synthase small subunit [Pontiella sulfatireligans]VGO23327.1 Putative acetolactate synthase small subunit [Pontiella sulfatireligans]